MCVNVCVRMRVRARVHLHVHVCVCANLYLHEQGRRTNVHVLYGQDILFLSFIMFSKPLAILLASSWWKKCGT